VKTKVAKRAGQKVKSALRFFGQSARAQAIECCGKPYLAQERISR